MKLAEIPRMRVGQEIVLETSRMDSLDRERADLAIKAKNLLGYRMLSAEMSGNVLASCEQLGKLAQALLANDIEVLDIGKVFSYQTEEAARRTKAELERLLRSGNVNRVFQWGFHAAAWQHTAITAYVEPIPEFVLQKAVQIKEHCPEVQFFIHHLNDPKADPFLVAMLGDEVYYVEAWEEPRFEGRAI